MCAETELGELCVSGFFTPETHAYLDKQDFNKISLEITLLLVPDSFFFTVSGLCRYNCPDFWVQVPAERAISH